MNPPPVRDHSSPCETLIATRDKFDYFIERTDKRFDQLEEKMDSMLAFKYQIIGASTLVSTAAVLLIEHFLK